MNIVQGHSFLVPGHNIAHSKKIVKTHSPDAFTFLIVFPYFQCTHTPLIFLNVKSVQIASSFTNPSSSPNTPPFFPTNFLVILRIFGLDLGNFSLHTRTLAWVYRVYRVYRVGFLCFVSSRLSRRVSGSHHHRLGRVSAVYFWFSLDNKVSSTINEIPLVLDFLFLSYFCQVSGIVNYLKSMIRENIFWVLMN